MPLLFLFYSTEENYRLRKIQTELQATLRSGNSDSSNAQTNEKPQFEYAFAAACKSSTLNYILKNFFIISHMLIL